MISIITPCKNAEKTIERTMLSVISQNIDEYEYIIIDGLSGDNTVNIIEKYAKNNPNIKLISEKDNSMTEALNKGMKQAKGEYVCSINADDEYKPNVLKKVVEYMDKTQCDVLVTSTDYYENGKLVHSSYPRFMMNYFLFSVLDCSAPECSVFFRKDSVDEAGYFNEKIKYTQDYELYLRMMKLRYKYEFFDIVTSNFYYSEEQYSTRLFDDMLNEACTYNQYPMIFKFLKKTHINNKIKQIFRWVKRY